MFKRVLVANRGEIALRIIRACHEEGLEAVAVYSEADRLSAHVRAADAAVPLGAAPASESYLNIPKLIAAAAGVRIVPQHPEAHRRRPDDAVPGAPPGLRLPLRASAIRRRGHCGGPGVRRAAGRGDPRHG